ncbi:uncharacterized protein VICG_01575 [Vittaforma corneae ATCC 50505]|uniref:dUTP diphosphatase n=1 Tax=Vittaforma corneae (strain ATCC 50505) TaxID=993615 RepID=L2GLF1_VITCO|nr:uncharacterized protein VICG_01575 [Vittaforma corneae ATCC 50505]ELA41335.1 hypothetical protein VICG_01575 [Vittaforma corneae ATCC 50505]
MAETVPLEKSEKWAQLPAKERTTDRGYCVYNVYTAALPRGKPVVVSSGLIFPELKERAVLILGHPPTNLNRNVETRSRIIGAGDLSFTCVNFGENDIELDPLTRITKFVVLRVAQDEPVVCEELDETERGHNGFGSTGLK